MRPALDSHNKTRTEKCRRFMVSTFKNVLSSISHVAVEHVAMS